MKPLVAAAPIIASHHSSIFAFLTVAVLRVIWHCRDIFGLEVLKWKKQDPPVDVKTIDLATLVEDSFETEFSLLVGSHP